jgi:hypothetical protein
MEILPAPHSATVEHNKIVVDYLKHLTTLSTGAIILQIAFLEKLFAHPKWKALIVISLLSFAVAVIASVIAYTAVISTKFRDWEGKPLFFGCLSIYATWVSFLLGITSLTAFAIRNLLTLF